jgi:asparagine synthase (glutamine-hydrolysing)
MCGIAGVLQLDGTLVRSETVPVLSRMGAQMSRRGPDNAATYFDDCLGLIFRRLSIVDLAGGMQPFHSEDDRIILAANGEIFNHQDLRKPLESRHRFRSHSDCEVLLHLYEEKGLDFLDQVNGMYGCVVWDKRKRRLVLGRDRLGIKPLFYCVPERQTYLRVRDEGDFRPSRNPEGGQLARSRAVFSRDGTR